MRRCTMGPLLGLLLHLLAGSAAAQGPMVEGSDPAGSWSGSLLTAGSVVPVVLRIPPSMQGGAAALLDVPLHGVFDQPVQLRVTGDSLQFDVVALRASFRGRRSRTGEAVEGTWSQQDARVPLHLVRTSADSRRRRPQDPLGPLPYAEVAVAYHSTADSLRIAGTLTLPPGAAPHPAVVLIAGSGPHDRDGSNAGHRPFLVLADHLARRGIAVLRFDERGVGESAGDFARATTADLAEDVHAAVRFLAAHPAIDGHRIGLVGHSEGGMIAPMVSVAAADVAFLVLLGAPGVPLRDVALRQAADMTRAEGMSEAWITRHIASLSAVFDLFQEDLDATAFIERARPILRRSHAASPLPPAVRDRQIEAALATYALPWTQFAFRYDPVPALREVRVPVLALSGSLDTQVCAATNLAAIAAALAEGGNRNVASHMLPGLNHYFQTAQTGAMSEYALLDETFAPAALHLLSGWIHSIVTTAVATASAPH